MRVTGEDGAPVEIPHQIQLYTTNDLLTHPLVSPALAYLGGLPPLFVVASDREVLRDEIVYTSVIVMLVSDSGIYIDGFCQGTPRCESGEISHLRCGQEAVPSI